MSLLDFTDNKDLTLEQRLANERVEWSNKISDISAKMKRITDIPELMGVLYTQRQLANEYFHYLISLIIGLNKQYNAKYSERHTYYSTVSQIRYPNESTKHTRILADLGDLIERRAILDNHSKFMSRTVESFDAIIYAISKRVEVEQIIRGN